MSIASGRLFWGLWVMLAILRVFLPACGAVLQAVVSPWVALAMRLFLAQGFVILQVAAMMSGGLARASLGAPLRAHWWSLAGMHAAQSGGGAGLQFAAAVLLGAGLLSRPVAAALLVEICAVALPAAEEMLRPFWIVLLGWIAVEGPGPFSLDCLLEAGVRSSAVPAARAVAGFYGRVTAWLGPSYVLGLRWWLAAALAAVLLPWMGSQYGTVLPHVPSMVARLPVPLMVGAAVLLACGLAVRPVCGVLLVLVPVGQVMTLGDERLYWLLALAALLARGGDVYALDAVLAHVVSRVRMAPDDMSLPHVVVVGGGFGGVAAAKALRGSPCRVTIVDKRNYTLFQPLLYQVATASLSPADIATPIRALFRDQANVRVLLGNVTGVDVDARAVEMGAMRLEYDYLVLATGAQHGYFGNDAWAPFAPGLKTIEDATAIRHRLLEAFERAENAADAAECAAWLTFVVVGGGPTGVELAGAIAELAHGGLTGEFRRIDPSAARIILVQSGSRLLPAFPQALSEDAARRLRALHVEVRLDHKVEAIDESGALVGGERVAARTVLWAAGVMASPAASWVGAKADRAGRVIVDAGLAIPGVPDVYVVGDTAAADGWNGNAVPGLAPAAKQGGVYVAAVIAARLQGKKPLPAFRYRHFGSLATIGRKAAVADFGFLQLKGASAWWLWGLAHIAFLIGGRSKIAVMVEWLWAYLTFRRSTRLITGTR